MFNSHITAQRSFNRSSAAKLQDRAIVAGIKANLNNWYETAMALLLGIKKEEENILVAVWNRKDADEFAQEIKQTIAPKLSAKEISELETELDKPAKGISKFRQTAAERAAARKEIAELAQGAAI